MNKILKYSLIFLLMVFGCLQFFRGDVPENRIENPDDIFLALDAPMEVPNMMRAACYDCHSMETKYPWYSKVAPISWWIFDHIEDGREELNFSNFNGFEKRRKLRKLKEIAEEVEKEKMPLPSYIRGHSEANLTDEQRKLIQDWANQAAKDLVKGQPEE